MDWQDMAAVSLVGAVAFGWAARAWRRRGRTALGRLPCGTCCDAHKGSPPAPLVLRARKGERPSMTIRLR